MKRVLRFWAKWEKAVTLTALGLAVLFPILFTTPFILNIGVLCGIYAILALSLNFISGHMGIITLGHAAFYGIGAYTAAILSTRFGWDFLLTLLAAAAVSCLAGMMIGLPTLRLTGRYLSIVTLSFCEICRILEVNLDWLTRGPRGIVGIPSPTFFGWKMTDSRLQFYLVLLLVIAVIYLFASIMRTGIGRGISAIKGDEIAAEAMGVHVYKYKIMTFAISAMVAGIAGAFYAHYVRFIDPTSFASAQSTLILSMAILGGLGNTAGMLIGATALAMLPELLRSFMELRMVIYGGLLVLMVLFRPQGILGGVNLKHIRQREGLEREVYLDE